jgi:hypothetical protein
MVCGREDEFLEPWREHDERDAPIAGAAAVVLLGSSKDHDACHEVLKRHPRLYAPDMGSPGSFPVLCGPCDHRRGAGCAHPDLKANGGAGLRVVANAPFGRMILCTRESGCLTPPKVAVTCDGQAVARTRGWMTFPEGS